MGVSKVEYYGETLMDTTETTVSEETLMEGETALNAAGEVITGNLKPVKYTAQSPTEAEQAQARKNIDALGTADLPEAVSAALAEAKASGEFDGADGDDGDPGADGVGIQSIEQVTASTEDGGDNVWRVTLTNDVTADFTVKNGNKGEQGDVGKTAYEYAKDGGYTGTEEDFMDLVNTIDSKADNKHGHTWEEVGLIHHEGGSNTITSDDVIYNAYHKVCDNTPTLAEVQKGGRISYYSNGELVTANFLEGYFAVLSRSDSVIIAYDGYPFVVIALEDRITYNGNSFTRGTHFCQDSYFCVHSLTINNYEGFPYDEAQKIPSERLPDDIGSVKTVNNVAPDENGNITIDVGSGGGGGSTECTWDDLALYDTVKDLIITSDDVNYGGYHKVSDEVPTLEQLQTGGTVTFTENGAEKVTSNYPEGDIAVMTLGSTNGAAVIFNGLTLVAVAFEDGATVLGNTLDEKGIYFVQNDMVITHSLTIKDYPAVGINPIPVDYLPESHQFYETSTSTDVLTWDGNTDGLESVTDQLYRVSGAVPTLEDLQNGGTCIVNLSGVENTMEFTSDNVTDTGTGVIIVADFVFIVTADGADLEGIAFPKAGIYFGKADLDEDGTIDYVSKLTINGYTFKSTEIKKLHSKYLEPFDYVEGSETVSIDLEEGFVVNQIYKLTDDVLTTTELAQAVITVENGNGTQTITVDTDTIVSEGSFTFGNFKYLIGGTNATATITLFSSLTANSDMGVEIPSAGTYIFTFAIADSTATKVSLTVAGKKMGGSLTLKPECFPNQEEEYIKPTFYPDEWGAYFLRVNETLTASDGAFSGSLYNAASKGGFKMEGWLYRTVDGEPTKLGTNTITIDFTPAYTDSDGAYIATSLVGHGGVLYGLYATITETETTFKLMELALATS